MKSNMTETADLTVHSIEQGDGPAVFLLHGWPETSLAWRHVMPLLSKRFRVIAPDLRGTGKTSKPQFGYGAGILATDLLQLADALDIDEFSVVGHDWGGAVAFATALSDRRRVRKVGIVDVVVPGDGRAAGGSQGGARWHHAFHRVPGLAEALTVGREEVYLRWFFSEYSSMSGAVPEDVLDQYVASYSQPGAMTCGFNYYRAMDDHVAFISKHLDQDGKLDCPVLGVGGGTGRGRGDEVRASLIEVATNPKCVVIERSGHLVPEETPEELAAILTEFLRTN
jgi:pimeloyl-ACP methyl ester carboxylesterase